MKKLLILFLLISSTAYADQSYVYETDKGEIHVMTLKDSINPAEHLKSVGQPFKKIVLFDPSMPKEKPEYWKFLGNQIVVDTAKKQADDDAKAQKEERKRQLLKLTPSEYQEAKDLGLIQ